MDNFDLKKYLAEGKLLKEEFDGHKHDFPKLFKQIEQALKQAGADIKVFDGDGIPNQAYGAIEKNDKLAALEYGDGDSAEQGVDRAEYISVALNNGGPGFPALKKIVDSIGADRNFVGMNGVKNVIKLDIFKNYPKK